MDQYFTLNVWQNQFFGGSIFDSSYTKDGDSVVAVTNNFKEKFVDV